MKRRGFFKVLAATALLPKKLEEEVQKSSKHKVTLKRTTMCTYSIDPGGFHKFQTEYDYDNAI